MIDPSAYLTPFAAILLPVMQAAFTGLFFGSLGGSIAWAYGYPNPIQIGAITASGSSFLAWLFGIVWWRALVMQAAAGVSGQSDRKPEEPHTFRLDIHSNGGRTTERVDLPASEGQLYQVADLVAGGASLSHGNLSPIFGGSRPAVSAFQTQLVRRGLARWRHEGSPTAGIELTAKGSAVFRGLLGESDPTPLR